MADGIYCKHCGRQETEHKYPHEERLPKEKYPGYKHSFESCPRYVGESKPKPKDKSTIDFEMACYEQQARARAAMGAHSAFVRDQNLEKELADYDKKIKRADHGEKEVLKKKKEEFLENCRRNNTMHIG